MNRVITDRILATLACTTVAAIAFLLALAAGRGSHFNPDESRWISRAHYLADFADPGSPTWDDQYMTRGQPPLGSYAMGLGLLLQGRDLKTNPPWDFSLPWEVNVAIGNKPVPADLAAGRTASAALSAVTALVVIAVAQTFVSQPWAITAGTIYAVHPFTVYIGSIAMSDAVFGLLIACSAWAAAALGRRPGGLRAIALGGALGLGAATKLSPLAVAAGVTLAILLIVGGLAVRNRGISAEQARWGALGLLISATAIAAFVAVYPYLWPDPLTRTQHLITFRADEMAAQASDWPVMAVPTRLDAVRRVHANFSNQYNLSASVLTLTGFGPIPAWVRQIEIVAVGAGLTILVVRAARADPFSPRALALAVLGGQVLVTILGMRSEFDRYHLPMAILGAVAAAAALEWLVSYRLRGTSSMPRAAALRSRLDAKGLAVANAVPGRNGRTPREPAQRS